MPAVHDRDQIAVSFAKVTKRYGATAALDAVSFQVSRGEMVAVLGPNGAGKSTAVDLMLGLRRPTAGLVTVLGGPPAAAVAAGRVGAMLQAGGLPAGATVGEVVGLARRLYGSPRPLGQLLAVAGLSDLAGRRVQHLSGGQAQRVRLAVALAGRPDVLFLDEPTVGLDPEARRSFWQGVHTVAAEGATVLFATHYLEEADANATRVLVVVAGRLAVDSTPASVKARLADKTVTATVARACPETLRRLPGVTAAHAEGSTVELRTRDADATIGALFSDGLRPSGLQIEGASLEDALIALTEQARQQRSAVTADT
jgi:ABC-2 type transport system ATP-binding protein